MSRAFVEINGINMRLQYGLNLVSYSVGSPVPDIRLIEVPGRPGKLDATLALNGKVNYISRPIEIVFHIRNNSYEDWHAMLSELFELFDGTELNVVFSTDQSWFYRGRFTIDPVKTNEVTSQVTITCEDAFPYKLDASGLTSGWQFNPAVFAIGVTHTPDKTISSSGDVVCIGYDYNGTVTIYTSTSMSVTFDSVTYQLASGKNTIREIHFAKGENTLHFVGSGRVRVEYERGIL